jgi:hypothetical protein
VAVRLRLVVGVERAADVAVLIGRVPVALLPGVVVDLRELTEDAVDPPARLGTTAGLDVRLGVAGEQVGEEPPGVGHRRTAE